MAIAMSAWALALLSVAVVGITALPERAHIAMVTELEAEAALNSGRFNEILGDVPRLGEFTSFARQHGKKYGSVPELRYRFKTFVENVELIEATNAQDLPYKLGINKFADMGMDEFQHTYLGAGQDCSATKGTHLMRNKALPLKKDWRLHNIVSPVKDQASCGSCWTFSTTGSLESAHAQATGRMVLLSEQQLVDCAGEFNNFGCGGGLPSQAFEYIRYNGGLESEDAYPYTAMDGTCKFNPSAVAAKVYDVVNITAGAEDELKDAVAFSRPVAVAYEVVDGFNLYQSGVYTSTTCHSGPETVNHAVLAVGYDVSEDGIPHWIIKNSWGADWGDNGYFRMEMGKNMCGIATCASYPIVPEDLLR